MKAIGMIETRGLVGAIEAVDSMVKSANVEVLGLHRVGEDLWPCSCRGMWGLSRLP